MNNNNCDNPEELDACAVEADEVASPSDVRLAAHPNVDSDEDFTTDFTRDENEERGNWSGRLDFLLACLGYAVGLGNVWRFPYLCYKSGGAVFFIPYVIMLVFVGMPIFFLELSLGQFTSSGPLTCWNCVPIFMGIGVGMMCVSGMVAIYYNMIIAWSLFYLFASFTNKLPWGHCNPEWASTTCEDFIWSNITTDLACESQGFMANLTSGVCYDDTEIIGIFNSSSAAEFNIKKRLATEDYLEGRVWGLRDSDGIDDLGSLHWELVLCLMLAWIMVIGALVRGVKSSGKVVYFTALFPYVVLIILLIRGLTLKGFERGIDFYILQPNLTKLQESQVWKDAAVQIFFSLSDSWGGLIALSSYNRFHNHALRDSLIVSLGNCLTSFFAGFVIFSFMGFLAERLDSTVEEVATDGVGLAFTIYPDAVTHMPVSPLWAILFFLMLITLGLDSEFALMETVTTCVFDQFPKTRQKKWAVILVFGVFFFLLGLPLCTDGGAYMLQIMDHYAGAWNVMVIALCECIAISYIYGFMRFREDIGIMIGDCGCACLPWKLCSYWWRVCWCCFTPIGLIFVLIYSWVDYKEVSYRDYAYPAWGAALGWMMTFLVILGIFIPMFFMLGQKLYRGEPISELFKPNKYWGPAMPKHRQLMARYLEPGTFEIDPWAESSPQPGVDLIAMGNSQLNEETYTEKL
ncbi:hypothetical protein CAPTEDRAFT_171223 [Capitella teleta]|uniref:Transporter n=1 Tax=Capitella teleta TaxID=283909 RepID=R7UYQ0_CAPTE|nr:hypothetical protein CAPTEDRAFT_171223 [Capitella teleta]|eukprot:ELU11417.1 hypothetical protein CAPTEDRAFT_171223 [Capitella teleta]